MISLNQNGMGRIVPPEAGLIKDSSLTDKEVMDLRESFKIQYAKMKGWDPEKLTPEQLNEIHSDNRWKTPGLLLS